MAVFSLVYLSHFSWASIRTLAEDQLSLPGKQAAISHHAADRNSAFQASLCASIRSKHKANFHDWQEKLRKQPEYLSLGRRPCVFGPLHLASFLEEDFRSRENFLDMNIRPY
jgi:hypothetical protein